MSDSIRITEQFVGRPVAGVATALVEGEALLLDERDGRSHVLNNTAAIVWQCFDGEATLGEICLDISESLGLERTQVLTDTLGITAKLLELGVVEAATHGEPEPDRGDAPEAPVQEYAEYL